MEIKLTGKYGGVALVDKEDYEIISKYNWHQDDKQYAISSITGKPIYMHRFLMKPPKGMVVDHKNHNRLDNRKDNLRVITRANNGKNKSKTKNATSQYYGVNFNTKQNKYIVVFNYEGKKHNVGSFDNEIDAAEAYDLYLLHNNINYKNLNFPDKKKEYLSKEKQVKPDIVKACQYIGVTFDETYRARIRIDGKNKHLGRSKDPVVCAKMYDKYIVDNNLPNKQLNFPDDYPEYDPNIKQILTLYEEIDGNTIKLLIENNKGITVTIDKNDYDLIKYYKWYIGSKGYITAQIDNKTIRLHKYLTKTGEDQIVDHKDSNRANNTRRNLRILTSKGNNQNRSKMKNASSKYIGVSWDKKNKKWTSYQRHNDKYVHLGRHKEEEYAARRRDLYILENCKDDHFKLNFDWNDEIINEWKSIFNL